MEITPIQALNNNYIWMIQEGNHAVCVDPSDATPILKFLAYNHLILVQIRITHPYHDHISGAKALHNDFLESPIYGKNDIDVTTHTVTADTQFPFSKDLVTVWATPGYTDRHTSYLLENSDDLCVFRDDTLFSAGYGRVFTGTIKQLYDSLHRFNQLLERTLFYPAYECIASNLYFAQRIESGNAGTQTALTVVERTPTLSASPAYERKVNPFFRVHPPQVRARAEELSGRRLNSELEVSAASHELKGQF